MASNDNEFIQSSGSYKPPHLRAGFIGVGITMNNDTRYLNNNSKNENHNITNMKNKEYTSHFSKYLSSKRKYSFELTDYFDRKFKGSYIDYKEKIEKSTTLYVGNLNLVSTKADIHKLFSKAGDINNIIMGLNKKTLSPAGFCFVEFATRVGAENCKNMKDTLLDGKNVFIDWDAGFIPGRQYKRK